MLSDLTWNSHVDRITGNANRTLGFIRRNIKTKMPRVRETAYNTLVRPQLEYASAVWDPNTDKLIYQIEHVQRRAARWTSNNFCRQDSVTRMIEQLGWRTLEQRRADARLCLFYKKVQVGKDQEKAQSEKDSHSKSSPRLPYPSRAVLKLLYIMLT